MPPRALGRPSLPRPRPGQGRLVDAPLEPIGALPLPRPRLAQGRPVEKRPRPACAFDLIRLCAPCAAQAPSPAGTSPQARPAQARHKPPSPAGTSPKPGPHKPQARPAQAPHKLCTSHAQAMHNQKTCAAQSTSLCIGGVSLCICAFLPPG